MNDNDVKTMVRCLIGGGTEQEKTAIISLLARGAVGTGKRLVSSPGQVYKDKAGRLVRGSRKLSLNRAMYTGFAGVPAYQAATGAARAHPSAYRRIAR